MSYALPIRTTVENRDLSAPLAHSSWVRGAGGAGFLAILFAPVYIRNLKLQNYVDELTHAVDSGQTA
ncbi:MAG: hypothetical protein WDO73_11640 [Ignavibacteriota bacterium]